MHRASGLLLSTSVLVAALLAACGGGGGGGGATTPTNPTPPTAGSVVTVEIGDNFFDPRSVTIQPGQTVRWVRKGQDGTHTVTALDGTFDSGFAFGSPGATFDHTFDASTGGRTFEYSCQSHSVCCDMKGSVRVGDSAPDPDPGYG